VWLSHLADEMKNTLRELLKSCLRDAKSGKGGLDPNKYPSQVAALILMTTIGCISLHYNLWFKHIFEMTALYSAHIKGILQ